MPSPRDITVLLDEWTGGDRGALDRLLPLVYAELRNVAGRQLRHERDGHTLQPTALVHETYMRLVDQRRVDWRDRAHFFGVASRIMRRILVDHARRQNATKRGDGIRPVPIDDAAHVTAAGEIGVLALDDALASLAKVDPGLARLVELRAFAGLTIEEAAHVLNTSVSTVKREWRAARAWLTRELDSERRP